MSHQAESAFHTSARSWALLTIALELDSPKHIAQVPFSSIANSKTQVYFLYFIFTICILTFVLKLMWVANYIPTFLKEHLEACVPNKGFASIPTISSNFELDIFYGDRYFLLPFIIYFICLFIYILKVFLRCYKIGKEQCT